MSSIGNEAPGGQAEGPVTGHETHHFAPVVDLAEHRNVHLGLGLVQLERSGDRIYS